MSIATRMMILQNRGPTDFDVVGSTYSNADVPMTNLLARSSLEGEISKFQTLLKRRHKS